MDKNEYVDVEMRKYEKTLLQRLTRLSKSSIYDSGYDDSDGYGLRFLMSEGIKSIKLLELGISDVEGCSSDSVIITPLSRIVRWDEDINPGRAKIRLNSGDADALEGLSRNLSLEGCHLTIDDKAIGRMDQPTIYANIAIGVFLTYLLMLFACEETMHLKLIAQDCKRILKPGDEIVVELFLVRQSEQTCLSNLTDGPKEITPYCYKVFTFSSDGLKMANGGIGKSLSHEYEREQEIGQRRIVNDLGR